MESRIRREVYVRFGEEYLETCHGNMKKAPGAYSTSCLVLGLGGPILVVLAQGVEVEYQII
ncbi:hypothetical protein B14911_10387 [Bacillus sp. NRRL B-14911]|nr:hypothetical protein B14911_10387 [Bacillus sp. NRRL B-14911]